MLHRIFNSFKKECEAKGLQVHLNQRITRIRFTLARQLRQGYSKIRRQNENSI